MRRVLALCSIMGVGIAAIALAGGQGAAPSTDEQSIKQAAAAYTAALDKGELPAIVAAWTPDADYVDDSGTTYKGREAIGKLYEKVLPELKANKVAYKLTSIRFVKGDVAVTDGEANMTLADGTVDRNRFTAVWVKNGANWLIASARDLPSIADPASSESSLKDLEWMVGDWTATDKGTTVKLTARWALERKFLACEFAVKAADGTTMTIASYAGWDPTAGTIRTWTFDSRGGFGEGEWARADGGWMVDCSAILPNGQGADTIYVIQSTGPDTFTWRATQREVDGQPLPDHELTYTRVK